MSDDNLKVGDLVQSKEVPTLIGRVVEIVEESGCGIVLVNDRSLFVVLDQWRKIRD